MSDKQNKKNTVIRKTKDKDPFSGRKISSVLTESLGECYIVGGALRDSCMGRCFSDIDIVLAPCNVFRNKVIRLAKKLHASAFEMDAVNQVWRITGPENAPFQLDIMPFQGKNLEEDILRRDFTVNALALKISENMDLSYSQEDNLFSLNTERSEIIDICGGLKDLDCRRLKNVSDVIFQEDPLRLMRAFRIAAEHGFKISRRTLSLIKRDADLISKSAGERIREELLKLLGRDDSCEWIKKIHACGLLFAIFPELSAQPGCAVDYYGTGGVLRHTFAVLDRTDLFFARMPDFCPHSGQVREHLSAYKTGIYKFIALMHDIAKPAKAVFINGRLRFFGHEECGALMTRQIMERLHFSKDETRLAYTVIGSHLRPGNLAVNETVSERAMFRLFRVMGDAIIPLLVLCWADYASYITLSRLEKFRPDLSNEPPEEDITKLPYNSPKKTLRFLQVIYAIARKYMEKGRGLKGKSYVDGNDVMRITGIKPGPRIGNILEQLRLMQFEEKIKDRSQALAWLEKQKIRETQIK